MDYTAEDDKIEESWIKEKEKVHLRENLLKNMDKTPKKAIMNQYLRCVQVICESDYPKKWPQLLNIIK
jgi:hypothetical protein